MQLFQTAHAHQEVLGQLLTSVTSLLSDVNKETSSSTQTGLLYHHLPLIFNTRNVQFTFINVRISIFFCSLNKFIFLQYVTSSSKTLLYFLLIDVVIIRSTPKVMPPIYCHRNNRCREQNLVE